MWHHEIMLGTQRVIGVDALPGADFPLLGHSPNERHDGGTGRRRNDRGHQAYDERQRSDAMTDAVRGPHVPIARYPTHIMVGSSVASRRAVAAGAEGEVERGAA